LRFIVLLSGGLDSIVNFKCALDAGGVERAVTFDYGQAASENEKRAAAACARRFGVHHEVVDLGWYGRLLPRAMSGAREAPARDPEDLGDGKKMLEEAWIPNRNGVFVNIGAAFAESSGAGAVVIGLNREEARVFPDNSEAFMKTSSGALKISTLSGVEVVSFTVALSKAEIVRLGIDNGSPLDLVYSCYRSSPDQRMCGQCQSCLRLKGALEGLDRDLLSERFVR
jgi:7-cyano-7-deazaguanine synthase